MPELKRSLGFWDGLAMVVGIMVGTGIFRTPGLVAQQLGRPWLTFVAWAAGGAIAFLGALIYAVAIAAIGVVAGEYAGRLVGATSDTRWIAGAMVVVFTGINLLGVASGRIFQNLATAAKVA